jgi:cyclophilin family peptidyl-prolyl cis-trans isomerase/HEAT repeat protein/DNA-binding phage protein
MDKATNLESQHFVKTLCKGMLVIMTGIALLFTACVPVEEKVQVPFDINPAQPKIRMVFDLQNDQNKDSLIMLLANEDPALRYAAARAFASFQDTSALEALLPLLMDAEGQVRMMAAIAVGQLGTSKAEAPLTAAFDGRDSARLFEPANGMILESMGKIGNAQFLRALSTISTYQSIDTLLLLGQARGIYRYALRDMIDPEGTATMVRYLADASIPIHVRVIAANYLHRAQGIDLATHADQIIASWHGESNPYLRICLATALGKVKSPASMKELSLTLPTESDYRVKSSILRALQNFDYKDVHLVLLGATADENPHVAEVAAQYFVVKGQEKDVAKYKAAMKDCKSWQAKTRMAEAANKYTSSMVSSAKTALQNEIQEALKNATDPYEKAAWLKAWGSELRNFESIPKYMEATMPSAVRTQAVTTLIDACKDKNFDAYFAGEGYLIKAQIGGYLTTAMKTGDAGIIALIAGAITDPKTGMKEVLKDKRSELNKALAGLKLPDEMETYLEVSKALKEYGLDAPVIPDDQKKTKSIDWKLIDQVKPGSTVVITTTKGDISFKLFSDRAPASVTSFIQLTNDGYYNGKTFHRVVPNFVIQTGCPRGDGFGGLDFTLRSELAGTYYDDEGYVGMASAGPHTEGPQFFITHSPAPHLDGRYTIIGKVTSGMDVVHDIEIGDAIKQINIRY